MIKKALIITAIILLTLLISVMVMGPFIARKYVNKNGRELVGRNISLDKIRVNYFSFTIRVIGFKLFEKDDTTLFTGFDTLLVDLQPFRLIRSELVVKKLWLIKPVSTISKKDTLFNFSDVIDFFSVPDTTAVTDTVTEKSDYKFEFSDIRLIKGHITYTDMDINHTTALEDLSFTIPYLSWNQEESSKAGLKFNFRNGGYFMADGSFDPGSGDFSSKIIVNNLDISEFANYAKPYLYINSIAGLAGCDLTISGNSDQLENLAIKGLFSVDSFSVTDNRDRKIIGVDKMALSLNNSFPMSDSYAIDSLVLTKPYLLFEMLDSSNNFLELLPGTTNDTLAQTNADTLSEHLNYSVNSFSINNGIVDFVDLTLKNPFKYHLSQIKLKVDSLSSTSSWVKAFSGMKLNEKGDLKAEIGVNPSDPYELKVEYVISNFQLTDISPYSLFYVGSAIVYGNMYYAGKTSITARQITSENKLIIRNAEIGKKSGGIFNIPLRLALYLIKDMNGDIKIVLPVSGNLNDPDIKIGKLIWATFKNFIIKVAASPFIALSNLFGVDQKDLQQLDFNYADTLLSNNNAQKLDQLLMIKDRKPELNVELAYFNDREKEKEQLGFEEAGRIFREQTGGNYLDQKAEFESFLKKSLVKDTVDLYNDCIRLAGIEKISAMSKNRENLRIRLVEDYLKAKDTLSRIKLFIPNPEAIKNTGSLPVFEIKFSMEE